MYQRTGRFDIADTGKQRDHTMDKYGVPLRKFPINLVRDNTDMSQHARLQARAHVQAWRGRPVGGPQQGMVGPG